MSASDAEADDAFGYQADLDGDYAVVADQQDQNETGAVYVFERNFGGVEAWGEAAKLVAPDGKVGDEFGHSVDVEGDLVLIGARLHDAPVFNQGAAYLFRRDASGVWEMIRKLTASDAPHAAFFGYSVALQGDTAIVGAEADDEANPGAGALYVFERDHGGPDNWGEVKKILPSGSTGFYSSFGLTLDLQGDTLFVGALGEIFILERNEGGPDNWGLVTFLHSPADHYEAFGFVLAAQGDRLAVGGLRNEARGELAGAVHLYERDLGGANQWGFARTLYSGDIREGDQFGWSVDLEGDRLVVGARYRDTSAFDDGAVYVFERDQGGAGAWGEVEKLVASERTPLAYFGSSVALDGTDLLVGAFGDSFGCPPSEPDCRAGGAYFFKNTASLIFADSFTSGSASAWSESVPLQ